MANRDSSSCGSKQRSSSNASYNSEVNDLSREKALVATVTNERRATTMGPILMIVTTIRLVSLDFVVTMIDDGVSEHYGDKFYQFLTRKMVLSTKLTTMSFLKITLTILKIIVMINNDGSYYDHDYGDVLTDRDSFATGNMKFQTKMLVLWKNHVRTMPHERISYDAV